MKNILIALGSSLGFLSMVGAAQAAVIASPTYQNLGQVARGQTATTTIHFMNTSATPVRFFNVHCMGDLSAFSCSSTCFSLPAFGSCTVFVRFSPFNGDGLSRTLYVNGQGDGQFSSATVQGTERKSP